MNYRGDATFSASGKASARMIVPALIPAIGTNPVSIGAAGGDAVTATNSLPQQVAFGGFYDVSKDLKLFAQYDFTEYQKNAALVLSRASSVPLRNLAQNWNNMSNLRLAAQYKLSDWTLRGGYVFTSPVTPKGTPSLVFSPPGSAHSFVLGAGKEIFRSLTGDLAVDKKAYVME